MKNIFLFVFLSMVNVAYAGKLEDYSFSPDYVAPLKFDVQQAEKIMHEVTSTQQVVQTVLHYKGTSTVYAHPIKNERTGMLEQFSLGQQRSEKTGKVESYILSHNDVWCGNLARTTSSVLKMNADQSFRALFETYLGARVYDDLPCQYQGAYASAPPTWLNLLTLDTKQVDAFLQLDPHQHPDLYAVEHNTKRSIIRFKPSYGVSLYTSLPSHKVFAYERHYNEDSTVHYVVLDRYFVCQGQGTENIYVMLIFKQDGTFDRFKEGNSFQSLKTEPMCRDEAQRAS